GAASTATTAAAIAVTPRRQGTSASTVVRKPPKLRAFASAAAASTAATANRSVNVKIEIAPSPLGAILAGARMAAPPSPFKPWGLERETRADARTRTGDPFITRRGRHVTTRDALFVTLLPLQAIRARA